MVTQKRPIVLLQSILKEKRSARLFDARSLELVHSINRVLSGWGIETTLIIDIDGKSTSFSKHGIVYLDSQPKVTKFLRPYATVPFSGFSLKRWQVFSESLEGALECLSAGIPVASNNGAYHWVLQGAQLTELLGGVKRSAKVMRLFRRVSEQLQVLYNNEQRQQIDEGKERQQLTDLFVHELRSPLQQLTFLKGNSDNLGVHSVVEHAQQMVSDFLSHSQTTKVLINYWNVNELFQELQWYYGGDPRCDSIQFDEASLVIECDRVRLMQSMIVVIDNAVTASGSGGQVVLSVEEYTERVRIVVQNNGPYIPVVHQNKLFVPYFTTNSEGTGLGLYGARKRMRAMGGDLSLFASTEECTTFLFELQHAI
ncbi:MAG: HAMP domain-containing histidine kinase [Fibrobacterales bacterium]